MIIPEYPSIPLLARRPEVFFVKEVICTEKLHGSNFRVHIPLGAKETHEFRFGSRETLDTDADFPLRKAVEWFTSRPELLTSILEVVQSYGFSEVTIFGEAFGPGINAKGVRYTTEQEMLFRSFDIMVGTNFLTYDLFVEVTEKMGLPRVPEVWRGDPKQEYFDDLLKLSSTMGRFGGIEDPSNTAEGIVIRSNPLFRNNFGEWLIAKHKGGKFAEKAHAPKEKVVHTNPAEGLVATFVTEGRVRNVLGHLHDRGVLLQSDMTDMPLLIPAIVEDLMKECSEEIAALQLKDVSKALTGTVSKALGPIYRQLLAEK